MPIVGTSLENNNHKVFLQVIGDVYRGEDIDKDALKVQTEIIESMKNKARVFVVMLYTSELTQFLITAKAMDMMNGEYAFISQLDIMDPTNPIFEGVIGAGMLKVDIHTY